jgi:hypothetical protein
MIGARATTLATPGRNRANAAWLRVQISALRAELLRAEAYGCRQLSNTELRKRLTAMLDGKESA